MMDPPSTGMNIEAGPSKPRQLPALDHVNHLNPQLGSEPWFSYPKPTGEEIEDDLPPYDENESLPMSFVLERVVRKAHGDLRTLLQQTLPASTMQKRPRHIIDYSKSQRQAVLKYLALLRWKSAVDIPHTTSSNKDDAAKTTENPAIPQSNINNHAAAFSFPTPHSTSNGESNNPSPAALTLSLKGKGKAVEEEKNGKLENLEIRGKVTDAKRITQFLEHQNHQHEQAILHIQHVAKIIESLRERNPDLLTAISLYTNGTYNRLPTSITDDLIPLPKLTNRKILRTLRRLNRHLRYRIQCVDYLPPEMLVETVKDGRVYIRGGGKYGWKAQMTVIGFGDGADGRWWLTGIEWTWQTKDKRRVDGGMEESRKVEGEERQGILDLVNEGVLDWRGDLVEAVEPQGSDPQTPSIILGTKTEEPEGAGNTDQGERGVVMTKPSRLKKVDAPLVRLYNFLQHLSLSYQLETLFTEALKLSQGKFRDSLQVEMKRDSKSLIVKYWMRAKSMQNRPPLQRSQTEVRFRPQGVQFGGTITVSIEEIAASSQINEVLRAVAMADMIPNERLLNLGLTTKWEIGEGGVAGGLKAGDMMDTSTLTLDPGALSFEKILDTATTSHARLLLQNATSSLLSTPRITLFPLNPPKISEDGLSFLIPLPSKQKSVNLSIGISPVTGLLELEDQSGVEVRVARTRQANSSIVEGRMRLIDDIIRLITAVITDNLESQMRQLGWGPTRRLSIRYQDLPKDDLFPASSIFVPLPTSSLHFFTAKVTSSGISFELLRLNRVPAEGGAVKLALGDRIPLDLPRLKARRTVNGDDTTSGRGMQDINGADLASAPISNYEMSSRDLRDLFIFSNALVAQTIIEQQLKDRSIPYTLHYPSSSEDLAPRSSSAVAGMIPTICVNARDLLKDGRAAEVAMPRVFLQIREWWKGAKCQVVTIVQLRHRSSSVTAGTSPAPAVPVYSANASSEGITFDPSSSIVRFRAADITRCVPSFLEQWERLSKVIVVAGEVNRLNKSKQFKSLRMLSFDLRTATLSYSPGYNCSITYTPLDDSYKVTFSADEDENPHSMLADLLSYRLNELSQNAIRGQKNTAKLFCELLCSTLPVLLEIKSIQSNHGDFPKLVVRSVSSYRLVWDIGGTKRYSIDILLAPQGRYIISDSSKPKGGLEDISCGPLTAIPGMQDVVSSTIESVKGEPAVEGESGRVKLDNGETLMCGLNAIRRALGSVAEGVEEKIGYQRLKEVEVAKIE